MRAPNSTPAKAINTITNSALEDVQSLYAGVLKDKRFMLNSQQIVDRMQFPSIMTTTPSILLVIIPSMQKTMPLHILLLFMYALRFVFISKYLEAKDNPEAITSSDLGGVRVDISKHDHFSKIPKHELEYFHRHLQLYIDSAHLALMDKDRIKGRDTFIRCNEIFFNRMLILIAKKTLQKGANDPIRPNKKKKDEKQNVIAYTEGFVPVIAPMKPSEIAPANDENRNLWESEVYKHVNYLKGYNECIKYNNALALKEMQFFYFEIEDKDGYVEITTSIEEKNFRGLDID